MILRLATRGLTQWGERRSRHRPNIRCWLPFIVDIPDCYADQDRLQRANHVNQELPYLRTPLALCELAGIVLMSMPAVRSLRAIRNVCLS